MFTGEGLGESRDNFSINLARLKNLRQRFGRVHRERDAVLARVQASADEPVDEPAWTRGIDLHWLARDEREWLLNEHNTTLEMMFIYLVSMLDVFFSQFGQEHHLFGEGEWPSATAKAFRNIGLQIQPAAESQLDEYRARRNALVHRGGIANTEYCTIVRDRSRLGQRLAVTETYLDNAVEYMDHLVAATAVAKYEGPPRYEANDLWPALIARVFIAPP